jgi:hypothetical protein
MPALIPIILLIQATVLLSLGQLAAPPGLRIWDGTNTSQHLLDWYSLHHVIHGVVFYWLLYALLPRAGVGVLLTLAVGVEAAWECLENSPPVIARYREQPLAGGYAGDSVVNSLMDNVSMMVGLLVARALPAWGAVLLVLGIEALTLVVIRDALILNVLGMVWTPEWLARWQQK